MTEEEAPAAAPKAPVMAPKGASASDLIAYYSYCTCGRPVVNHAYRLTAPDWRELRGVTDRFGMILVQELETARVDYGASMRPRSRSYTLGSNADDARRDILNALSGEHSSARARVNDQLTALLDLRRIPLEEARSILVGMLDHGNSVIWRNAAVTLSYYGSLDEVVAHHTERLARADVAGNADDALRHLTIVGALRDPASVSVLSGWLTHEDAMMRQVAAYSLGFIGHPSDGPPELCT